MNAQPRYLPFIGRFLIAVIFLISGVGKISAPEMTQGYIAAAGLPVPALAYAVALIVEIGCAILLLVGYRTRTVALIMALYTVVAAIGFHAHFADQNQTIHFLKNLAITGGLLQVVAFGAGGFSVDSWRSGHSDQDAFAPPRGAGNLG